MSAYATPITESVETTSAPRGSGFLTRDEVMTAREVAELLRMPTSTVYELARKGEIPGIIRLGSRLVISRARFEAFLLEPAS